MWGQHHFARNLISFVVCFFYAEKETKGLYLNPQPSEEKKKSGKNRECEQGGVVPVRISSLTGHFMHTVREWEKYGGVFFFK